jgi:hypothetical protein
LLLVVVKDPGYAGTILRIRAAYCWVDVGAVEPLPATRRRAKSGRSTAGVFLLKLEISSNV